VNAIFIKGLYAETPQRTQELCSPSYRTSTLSIQPIGYDVPFPTWIPSKNDPIQKLQNAAQ